MVMVKGCTPALAVLTVWQMESVQFIKILVYRETVQCVKQRFCQRELSLRSLPKVHLTCSDSYTLQLLTMGILPLASVQLLISSSFPLKMISLTCPCKRSNLMHLKKV